MNHHRKSQRPGFSLQGKSDREVTRRSVQELLKLKVLSQFGRHSERFLGYPNTLVMNLCRRELERRGLPIPPVNPSGEEGIDTSNAVRETADRPVSREDNV